MRRPVFWFLWPDREPGPLDEDATQSSWVRVCGRGPWRWAFLIVFTVMVATLGSAAVAAALSDPGGLAFLVSAVVVVPLIALLSRAWVAGTYVSDRGVKVSSVLATDVRPWSAVTGIDLEPTTRLLGTPVVVRGQRVLVLGDDGPLVTHIETASPDLWLRPAAWSAGADRLGTWLRESREP